MTAAAVGIRSHDLTARVASSRADSRAGSRAEDRPHVLLVDDQPNQVLPWLERVLPDYAVVPVSSTEELQRLLRGETRARLGDGPFRPVAALVDLDLGGPGSGLGAIMTLRRHPLTRNTTCILFTNGLSGRDDRDLQAVLCAYANGGGLLASSKDQQDGPRLAEILKAAEATTALGCTLNPTGPMGGLRYVAALRLRSAHTLRPPLDLVELLLGEPGLRALWSNYADAGADFDLAVSMTRDQFPDFLRSRPRRSGTGPGGHRPGPGCPGNPGAPTTGRSGRNHMANDLLNKKDFGELPLSWHLYGGSFLNAPNTVMEWQGLADEDQYARHSARRRVLFGMFFARYGHLLMSRETHQFAQAHMATRSTS